MKTYTSEDLREFVKKCLADNENVVSCRAVNTPNINAKKFIRLNEEMKCWMDWRGEPQLLKPGDYLHADPDDAYALTAEKFSECYTVIG